MLIYINLLENQKENCILASLKLKIQKLFNFVSKLFLIMKLVSSECQYWTNLSNV